MIAPRRNGNWIDYTEAGMTKTEMELLNLRKRVEAQREEIKKLQAKIKELEKANETLR